MRPLYMTTEKKRPIIWDVIILDTKLTCLKNIILMMIGIMLLSNLLYAMPTADEYLSSIPSRAFFR